MLPHFVSEICLSDKKNRRMQQLDVVILQRCVLYDVPQGILATLVVCRRGQDPRRWDLCCVGDEAVFTLVVRFDGIGANFACSEIDGN